MTDVAAAREKLKRANEHVQDFEVSFTAFLRDNPQHLMHDVDAAGLQKTKFVRDVPIPGRIVCVVGDAVHNLRGALDHLACAVAGANGITKKRELFETGFTARKNIGEFNNAIQEGKVTRLGAAWVEFLRRVEPHGGGRGSDLYVIGALDNTDKHRALILVDTFGDTFRFDPISQQYVAVRRGLSFKDGVELALDPTNPNHHTHTQTRVVIRENVPGLDPNAWANDVLRGFVEIVRRTVDDAEADAALWPP